MKKLHLLHGKEQGLAFTSNVLIGFDLLFVKFKDSVAQFAQETIAPHAAEVDRTNNFPKVVCFLFFEKGVFLLYRICENFSDDM